MIQPLNKKGKVQPWTCRPAECTLSSAAVAWDPAADRTYPLPDQATPVSMHAGNPGQPTGLAILNQPVRIYGPSATNTLDLQASLP